LSVVPVPTLRWALPGPLLPLWVVPAPLPLPLWVVPTPLPLPLWVVPTPLPLPLWVVPASPPLRSALPARLSLSSVLPVARRPSSLVGWASLLPSAVALLSRSAGSAQPLPQSIGPPLPNSVAPDCAGTTY